MGVSKGLITKARAVLNSRPGEIETVRIERVIVEPGPDGPRPTGEVIERGSFERAKVRRGYGARWGADG